MLLFCDEREYLKWTTDIRMEQKFREGEWRGTGPIRAGRKRLDDLFQTYHYVS